MVLVQDASSESDDLGSSQAVMQASTAAGTDDNIWPCIDKQKQRKKVTGKSLRTKAPIVQRKKKVCRGLVYESDHDENADFRKVSTANKKWKSRTCALPKMKLATLPRKKPMEGGETLLGMEPVEKESLLQPSVLVEPSLVHDALTEPFDAMGSLDLFAPTEEDALMTTGQASPPVNMDELFGF